MSANQYQTAINNKYKTGTYLVLLFDKYGTQVGILQEENFLAAKASGDAAVKAPPNRSYVISRTLRNSLDDLYPWSAPEGALEEFEAGSDG